MTNRSITFFDTQFQRQIVESDFALNPFEKSALPYLQGRVLDLGCGLGNLAVAAARNGCSVLALDASVNAVERIQKLATNEGLSLEAQAADLSNYVIDEDFDVIVSIGLLMFFDRQRALDAVRQIQAHVRPGGYAVINALVEGTTYLDMFDPDHYYLFGRNEMPEMFSGWDIREAQHSSFDAPGNTKKVFSTVIARRTRQA